MGEVATVYKVTPKPEKKEEVKSKLNELGAKEIKEEEIGFGITALRVVFVIGDESGKSEELEKKIEEVEGVNSIEIEGNSLL